jgi:pilus assembly protein CpaF
VLGDAAILDLVDAMRRESSGAGPLDGLLRQSGVTDVLVNGPRQVFVRHRRGSAAGRWAFPEMLRCADWRSD